MFDTLFTVLKNITHKEVQQNTSVATPHHETTATHIAQTVIDGLKAAIARGKEETVVKILMGKEPIPGNSILGEIITAVKGKLQTHNNIPAVEAELLAGKIVPGVMGTLVTKANNSKDSSVQLRDILQTLDIDMLGDIEAKFGKYLKDDEKGPLNSLF